ncbi:alpha/beta fold hydrolase [Acidobacterium sp. S8]|uniref:alpha/beta fold hydrolase n=1 Tax=Acidobacterium sp. S8 TaxID=1641854 RepID=UPI00131C7757|nr:alpha/beta fold hydrolase [Acidobacterium sp. S8]
MFYRSGGTKLFAETVGEGQEIILLHPTPVHHAFWLPVAEMLAQHYRVILPDLRGHGQSEAGEGPITVEKIAEDIERLMNELEIGKAMFAGCSVGGYTLYELWRRMPQRISALAFCSSRPQGDADANRAKRQEWIEIIRQRGAGDFFEIMLNSLIGPTARSRFPQKMSEAREWMQTMRPEAVIAMQQGLAARPDSVATARTIRVPTCVVAAAEDSGSTVEDMKLLTEQIRNGGYGAEFHVLPDAGHYAPWEQPETVGPILRRFFDSVVG